MTPADLTAEPHQEALAPKAVVLVDASPAPPVRLVSLDALRGLTIVVMLLVNNVALDAQTPRQFMHADWQRDLRLADLVFPWFLLCVGIAIPFSAAAFRKTGKPWGRYLGKAIVRAVALFGLGCLVDTAINHELTFDMGVLQLIGLAYLVAAIVYSTPLLVRLTIAAVLLAGYGFAIQKIPFPGGAAGVVEERRNLILHFNELYLTRYRMDGLLSTIPTAALVLIGTGLADVLRLTRWAPVAKFALLVVAGSAMMGIGEFWSAYLPYNKPIWTSSYILYAGGTAAMLLAGFYLIVDWMKLRFAAFPLVVFGSNPIVAYVVPILVKVCLLQVLLVRTATGPQALQPAMLGWLKAKYGSFNGGWTYTVAYIVVWWLVLLVLYRKRLFLRV